MVSRIVGWLMVVASLAAFTVSPRPGLAAEARPKIFGGKVLEAQSGQNWFIMQAGASKRYSQVKVLCDANTRWTGMVRKDKQMRLGDSVTVYATAAKDGAFRAVTLELHDPNEKPTASKTTTRP